MSTYKVCNTEVLNIQWRFIFVVISRGSQHFVYFPNQRNQSLFYLSKYKAMRKQSANSCLRFVAIPGLLIEFQSIFDTSGDRRDVRQIGIKSVRNQQYGIRWLPRNPSLHFWVLVEFRGVKVSAIQKVSTTRHYAGCILTVIRTSAV